MTHDINRLQDKIDHLDHSLSSLASQSGLLDRIIHKPGWTTIAEFALVEASLDAVQRQVETVSDHYKRLVEAAGLVGGG